MRGKVEKLSCCEPEERQKPTIRLYQVPRDKFEDEDDGMDATSMALVTEDGVEE